MNERVVSIRRTTKETDIVVELNIYGSGKTSIDTGIGFFDHMLEAFGRHGAFDLVVKVKGDLHVDGHHSVEDTGIVLGQAFAEACADKCGMQRFGSMLLPMDEALILAACDLSGRGQLHWDVPLQTPMVGDFDSSLAEEFFIAFASNAAATLHVRELAGRNTHHVIEGVFKAVARALRQAVTPDARLGDVIPSTKGSL